MIRSEALQIARVNSSSVMRNQPSESQENALSALSSNGLTLTQRGMKLGAWGLGGESAPAFFDCHNPSQAPLQAFSQGYGRATHHSAPDSGGRFPVVP